MTPGEGFVVWSLRARGKAARLSQPLEQAPAVAAEPEWLLVDDGWAAPEPVVVEAEVVAVASDADERPEEAGEPQRSLFSWPEFMAGNRTSRRDEGGATKPRRSRSSRGRWSRKRNALARAAR